MPAGSIGWHDWATLSRVDSLAGFEIILDDELHPPFTGEDQA